MAADDAEDAQELAQAGLDCDYCALSFRRHHTLGRHLIHVHGIAVQGPSRGRMFNPSKACYMNAASAAPIKGPTRDLQAHRKQC